MKRGFVTNLPATGAAVTCFAVLVTAGASAYQPLPWDAPSREPVRPVHGRRPSRAREGPRSLFGTAGVSFDWTVRFAGGIEGLADGRGATLEIPATLPAWLVYAVFDPMAVFAPLSEEAWMSGFRGEGLGTSPVLDEVAFVFLLSQSTHDDLRAGGEVTCTRYGLGVKLAGPGPADRRVRGTLSAGWAWGDIDFDRRPDLDGTGPYIGLGVEARAAPPDRGGSVIGFRAGARWEWLRGVDGSGDRFVGRTFTAGAGVVFYW